MLLSRRHRLILVTLLIAVLLVAGGILHLLFGWFNGNITGFFWLGDRLPLSPFLAHPQPIIHDNVAGYDGQFFLALALDPSLSHPGTLAALDNPAYRYGRIGYPGLGYLLGVGQARLIPYALVVLNGLGLAGLATLGAIQWPRLPLSPRPRPWHGLLPLVVPGLWISLGLSTADLLAAMLLVASLLALQHNRDWLAVLGLGLCCLVRETFGATVLLLGVFLFLRQRQRTALRLQLSLIPVLLWQGWVRLTVEQGTSGVSESLTLPFLGLISTLGALPAAGLSTTTLFQGYCLALLLLAAGLVVLETWRTWPNPDLFHVAVLPKVALLMLGSAQIFEYYGGYLRVYSVLFLAPILTFHNGKLHRAKVTLVVLSALATMAYLSKA